MIHSIAENLPGSDTEEFTAESNRVETNSGSRAVRVDRNGRELLEVYDDQNTLVFRFEPTTGSATLNVARGNLRFNCEQGDIEFQAAGAIRTHSREVEVRARQHVLLSVLGGMGKNLARLILRGNRLETQCKSTRIESQDLSLRANRSRWQSNDCEIKADTSRIESERHTIQADVLEENSTNRFQNTQQVSEVRAGRMRTLIAGLFQFRARTAMLTSEEDFKIKGDKVHLG